MNIYISILLATVLVQIPNVIAVGKIDNSSTLGSCIWIALMSAPISVAATTFFSYYYGKGTASMSYPALSTMALGLSLITSMCVHGFILKSKPISVFDTLGVSMIVIGFLVINFQSRLGGQIE